MRRRVADRRDATQRSRATSSAASKATASAVGVVGVVSAIVVGRGRPIGPRPYRRRRRRPGPTPARRARDRRVPPAPTSTCSRMRSSSTRAWRSAASAARASVLRGTEVIALPRRCGLGFGHRARSASSDSSRASSAAVRPLRPPGPARSPRWTSRPRPRAAAARRAVARSRSARRRRSSSSRRRPRPRPAPLRRHVACGRRRRGRRRLCRDASGGRRHAPPTPRWPSRWSGVVGRPPAAICRPRRRAAEGFQGRSAAAPRRTIGLRFVPGGLTRGGLELAPRGAFAVPRRGADPPSPRPRRPSPCAAPPGDERPSGSTRRSPRPRRGPHRRGPPAPRSSRSDSAARSSVPAWPAEADDDRFARRRTVPDHRDPAGGQIGLKGDQAGKIGEPHRARQDPVTPCPRIALDCIAEPPATQLRDTVQEACRPVRRGTARRPAPALVASTAAIPRSPARSVSASGGTRYAPTASPSAASTAARNSGSIRSPSSRRRPPALRARRARPRDSSSARRAARASSCPRTPAARAAACAARSPADRSAATAASRAATTAVAGRPPTAPPWRPRRGPGGRPRDVPRLDDPRRCGLRLPSRSRAAPDAASSRRRRPVSSSACRVASARCAARAASPRASRVDRIAASSSSASASARSASPSGGFEAVVAFREGHGEQAPLALEIRSGRGVLGRRAARPRGRAPRVRSRGGRRGFGRGSAAPARRRGARGGAVPRRRGPPADFEVPPPRVRARPACQGFAPSRSSPMPGEPPHRSFAMRLRASGHGPSAPRPAASSSPADSRVACCSACAARRRACGRSSPRMSSTLARLTSASTSCSSARRRRRSWRLTPATSSKRGRRSSGPKRQGLVDHALADEQERVVGQVGRIEQVDEILEPDPLAVEQVVVLAGAVEPPAQLQDPDSPPAARLSELSSTRRHIGHAERRPPIRAGEDHVLRLARPERATLLAEGPAERIGEVALARAIRSDDGADARIRIRRPSVRRTT